MLAHAQTHTNTTNSPMRWRMSVWTLSSAPLYRWLLVTGWKALESIYDLRKCETVRVWKAVGSQRGKTKSAITIYPSHTTQGSILIMHTATVYKLNGDLMCNQHNSSLNPVVSRTQNYAEGRSSSRLLYDIRSPVGSDSGIWAAVC